MHTHHITPLLDQPECCNARGRPLRVPDYDALARFYDLDHADYDDDLTLYREFARSAGGRILDVGTGTGRVALALAAAGAHVVGIDESQPMLDRAARKRSALGSIPGSSEFRFADARAFNLDERFQLAIMALNTFAHFLTAGDQYAALTGINRHLVPEGLLLLDLWNPTASTAKEAAGEVLHGYTRREPESGSVVSQFVATTADQGEQRLHIHIWYDTTEPDASFRRVHVSMVTRYCYRYELEWMLLHAGFDTEQVYGDYDLSPYSGSSPRLLVAARARRSDQ